MYSFLVNKTSPKPAKAVVQKKEKRIGFIKYIFQTPFKRVPKLKNQYNL